MKRIVSLLVAALTAAALPACDLTEDRTDPGAGAADSVAVVDGGHANMPTLDLDPIALVEAEIGAGSRLVIVSAEGDPEVVFDKTVLAEENEADQQETVLAVRGRFNTALSDSEPDTPEVDLLAAISEAGARLAPEPGTRTIVVTSSAISTAGPVALQSGLLEADATDVLESLQEQEQLPDLTGMRVVFLAMGATAGEQTPPDERSRNRLERLWTTLLEAAGAEVDIEPHGEPTSPAEDLPHVTPVPFRTATVDATAATAPCSASLADSTLGFLPDVAVFVDDRAAHVQIEGVAEQLRACTGRVTVSGTTSSAGTLEGRAALSLARAQKVALILADTLGRPVAEFQVQGLGCDWPGHVNDRDATGQLVPEIAALNRQVLVSAGD